MPHTHAKNSDFNACHWYWINEVFSFHIFPAVFRNALSWPCLFPRLFFKQSIVRLTKKTCCTWFSLLNNAQYPAMFSKLVLIKILVVWTRKHCFWLAKITSSEALNVVCFQRNLNRECFWTTQESCHPRRPRGSQSGLEKRRYESFQAQEETSSETQGRLVGPGEKARRKFSSTGWKAYGYRLSPDHFQTVKRMLTPDWAQKCFVLLCPICESNSISWVLFMSSYTTAITKLS